MFCGLILFSLIRDYFGVLQIHNAGNKLGRRCDMCSNYEKQLQGIQIQEAETRDQVSFFWGVQNWSAVDFIGGAELIAFQPSQFAL